METSSSGVLTVFYPAGWDGARLWYVDLYHNLLCCADLEQRRNTLVLPLPLPPARRSLDRWYGCAVYSAGRVVLVPLCAPEIAVYDIATKELSTLPLPENPWKKEEWYNLFQDAFAWGGCAYLVPGRYNRIVKVDPAKGTVQEFAGDYQALRPWEEPVANGVCGHAIVGEKVYLSYWQDSVIVEADLAHDTARALRVPGEAHTFSGICTQDGVTFWLVAKEAPVLVRWNRATGEVQERRIELPGVQFKRGLGKILDGGDHFWLLGAGNAIVCMDKATGQLTAPILLATEEIPTPVKSTGGTFLAIMDLGDGRAALSCVYTGEIAVLDLQTGSMEAFPSVLTDTEDIRRVRSYELKARWRPGERQIYGEAERWPLSEFIDALARGGFEHMEQEKAPAGAGEAIYRAVVEEK